MFRHPSSVCRCEIADFIVFIAADWGNSIQGWVGGRSSCLCRARQESLKAFPADSIRYGDPCCFLK